MIFQATGDHYGQTRQRRRSAQTSASQFEECHQRRSTAHAQAVLLPLELGLTLAQTAKAIGRSIGATCRMRVNFCAVKAGKRTAAQPKSALRNRAADTLEREARALDKVLANANEGGVVIIPRLKPLVEKELGHTIALSGLYRMLHRHNWRKLAPDTQHPKGDPAARAEWKKNCPPPSKTH